MRSVSERGDCSQSGSFGFPPCLHKSETVLHEPAYSCIHFTLRYVRYGTSSGMPYIELLVLQAECSYYYYFSTYDRLRSAIGLSGPDYYEISDTQLSLIFTNRVYLHTLCKLNICTKTHPQTL